MVRKVEIVLLSLSLFILGLEVYLIYQPLRKSLKRKDQDYRNLTNIIDSLENYSVIYLDRNFQIRECNKGTLSLFGYKKEDVLNQPLQKLLSAELMLNFPPESWEETIVQRGMVTFTGMHTRQQGDELYASSSLIKIVTDEGRHLGYTFLTLDQSLYQKNRMLAAQNKELEKFNYIASHDLKEPLRTIKGFLTLMETEYKTELDDSYQKMMSHIIHSANRMENLIQSLLSYAQTGSNIQFIEINVNHLLKAVTNDLKELMDERKAEIRIDSMPKVNGGSIEMRQLFQNIIANAIKYTPKTKAPSVQISCIDEAKFWHFTIEDNGYGIEEKYVNLIFEPFKRLHGSHESEGQGLGLAHCQKIVELHGGEIWVESVVNQGSTFHFTIAKSLINQD